MAQEPNDDWSAVPRQSRPEAPDAPEAPEARVVDSQVLLRGEREICIEHAGVRYRLRVTRRNRLILQK